MKPRKQTIPGALRKQVWIIRMGKVFQGKCPTTWCSNIIDVYDFESGHNIPESKGGSTTIDNLVPICASCNRSMGDRYTFDEWCKEFQGKPKAPSRFFSCFSKKEDVSVSSNPIVILPKAKMRNLFVSKVKKRLGVRSIPAR